jgi:hypothetical protein
MNLIIIKRVELGYQMWILIYYNQKSWKMAGTVYTMWERRDAARLRAFNSSTFVCWRTKLYLYEESSKTNSVDS